MAGVGGGGRMGVGAVGGGGGVALLALPCRSLPHLYASINQSLCSIERYETGRVLTTELAEENGKKRNRTARPTRPHGIRGRLYGFAPTRALGLRVGSRWRWARRPKSATLRVKEYERKSR